MSLLFLIFLHLTMGYREVVKPLMTSRDLTTDVICMLFLCWHLVTLVVAGAAASFMRAALSTTWRELALAGTIMIALLAIWSFVVVVRMRQRHRDMTQWIAFAVVALFGLAGHITT